MEEIRLRKYNVKIDVDTIYEAEDLEDCKQLVSNDFKGLDISDDVEIKEIIPSYYKTDKK